jgi:hypothetical protein
VTTNCTIREPRTKPVDVFVMVPELGSLLKAKLQQQLAVRPVGRP